MTRALRPAALALLLASPFTLQGCSAEDLKNQADCSASASGQAFVQAVGDLETISTNMKVEVATACRNIATAAGKGGDVTWNGSGTPTDEQVTQACNIASAEISATVSASGSFSLVIEGEAKCEANLQAQADCTATCSGNASCSGGVEASCDPGQLSVSCEGMCKAGAKCEGSPTLQVDCEGSCTAECNGTVTGGCDGVCEGMCDGMASNGQAAGACKGTCEGKCSKPSASASCKGKCSGSCTVKTDVKCSGEAKCTGGCSGTYKNPTCKVAVQEPSCEASAECKGNCSASAQAEAKCTAPKVRIVATGNVDAKFVSTLETELPRLLVVATAQGKAVVEVLGKVSGSIKAAVSSSAACALKLEAFVKASASVNVSVSASASASGSASAGK